MGWQSTIKGLIAAPLWKPPFPYFPRNKFQESIMAGTERQREIRRLRTRRKKTQLLLAKAKKGNASDKAEVVRKLRSLTPGADVIIQREGLA